MSPNDDVLVYAHPEGRDYVALLGEDGWFRWPAEANGWAARVRCAPRLAEECEELEPRLARLALALSGVTSE